MANVSDRGNLRFGLCGTGRWATLVHAPGLMRTAGVELVGVYGRDAQRASALAREHGVSVFPDFGTMLAEVDAVSFAVPPAIQARLALQAMAAGRHTILEKPIAADLPSADALIDAKARNNVRAVVFLTRLFLPPLRSFLTTAQTMPLISGAVSFGSGALLDGSGYEQSGWRHEEFGALWDVGPHVLGPLLYALGPVVEIRATRHVQGLFEGEARHANGATGSFAIDLKNATVSKVEDRYTLSSQDETISAGPFVYDRPSAYSLAAQSLVDGQVTWGSIEMGREIVACICAAQLSAETGGKPVGLAPRP